MQFVFKSYPVASQRAIVRYLLGSRSLLQPSSEHARKVTLFDSQVTLRRPYMLSALAELFEDASSMSKPNETAKDLLTSLTNE